MNELPVNQSCQGHIDRAESYPWVDICAPEKPDKKWVNQEKILKEVAKESPFSYEEIKDPWKGGQPEEERLNKILKYKNKALRKMEEEGFTEEFKKWKEENEKLGEKIEEKIKEFYEKYDPGEVKIRAKKIGHNFRVYSKNNIENGEELSKEEKEKIWSNF